MLKLIAPWELQERGMNTMDEHLGALIVRERRGHQRRAARSHHDLSGHCHSLDTAQLDVTLAEMARKQPSSPSFFLLIS